MMFCSGAPNSPDTAIRRSTSASPNIFLRRRRPRAYISLVSNFRSRLDFAGSFIRSNAGQLNWTGPIKPGAIPCIRSICPYKSQPPRNPKRFKTSEELMKLRSILFAGFVLSGLATPQPVAAADEYPTRQIKIIVPFPAGAGPDQVARLLGQQLQDAFGLDRKSVV